MKEMEPWMCDVMSNSSKSFFDGKDYGSYGMGGSIPFLAQLGNLYPSTEIIALGLIGPNSNAHAPNEAINLVFAKKLTMALSNILVEIGAHA